MDKYIEIINAASEGNRNKVLQLSREMKFLTGYESKVSYLSLLSNLKKFLKTFYTYIVLIEQQLLHYQIMEDAHVDAVMILGQVFDNNHEYYDFGGQDVTKQYVQPISASILAIIS